MAIPSSSFDIPLKDRLVELGGAVSVSWTWFFRSVYERLYPLGVERSFQLANDVSVAADVTDLKVNARGVSQAFVDYLVQRVTTGGSAVELIETGYFTLSYRPASESWDLEQPDPDLPDDSGVTFSVTTAGQVQYTSTDIAGDPSISRMFWRMRTMAGKSTQYSSQGAR
jgi:hypothetical protein